VSIEKTLFDAADKMRGAMDAGEYKHIALGLLFPRYISEAFQRLHDQLDADDDDDAEDPDEYLAESVFWVPEEARWSTLSKKSKDPAIGVMIDDAMRAIEASNDSLKGALPKVFGKETRPSGRRRWHRRQNRNDADLQRTPMRPAGTRVEGEIAPTAAAKTAHTTFLRPTLNANMRRPSRRPRREPQSPARRMNRCRSALDQGD